MSVITTVGTGWFWRWGAPLVVATSALIAAVAGADLLWNFSPRYQPAQQRLAVIASTFSAALLACWLLAKRSGVGTRGARRLLPQSRTDAVLAGAVVVASAVLAGWYLDRGLGVDESGTFLSYATLPFPEFLTTYDDTNNHLAHTAMVWVAHHFGGWNRVVLRLPAFLSFCLLLPAMWCFTQREYGATAATFTAALAGGSPLFVAYATNARGYTLLLLLFVVALLCGQALVRAPNRKELWAAWAAAVALGFYAVPVMVFPAVASGVWMLLARWRRCGRDQFGRFLAMTAGWSAAAVAVASALYLPAVATTGTGDFLAPWVGALYQRSSYPWWIVLLEYPFSLLHTWHTPGSVWAQGVFCALIVAGATAEARSCGRKGSLVLALVPAFGLFLLTRSALPPARLTIWALLILMIFAGVGAAFVFERTVARASALWPRIASVASRRILECASVAVLFGTLSWWTGRPRAVVNINSGAASELTPLLAMTSAVAERMRPGDYIAVNDAIAEAAIAHIRAHHAVHREEGPLYSALGQTARFRVSAPADPGYALGDSAASREAALERIFLFELVTGTGASRYVHGPSVAESLEAQWPSHELVATFGRTARDYSGSVYIVGERISTP